MSFSEGYMSAVTQVTSSSVSIDFLIELGKRKAGKFNLKHSSSAKGVPPMRPLPLLTEFDKGWLEGLYDTFASFKTGEVSLETTSDTFIPLKVIEKLINRGFEEADAKNKEEIKRFESMEDYRRKREMDEKYHKSISYPQSPHVIPNRKHPLTPPSHEDLYNQDSYKKKASEQLKKKIKSQYETKTNPTDRP